MSVSRDMLVPSGKRHGRWGLARRVRDHCYVRTSNGRRGDRFWEVAVVAVRLVASFCISSFSAVERIRGCGLTV